MKESVSILPKGRKHLANMGEQLKLARLRRKLSADQVAELAGISRKMLWHFRLKPAQAALIINEIKSAVSQWQKIAKKWGASKLKNKQEWHLHLSTKSERSNKEKQFMICCRHSVLLY